MRLNMPLGGKLIGWLSLSIGYLAKELSAIGCAYELPERNLKTPRREP